MMFTHDSVDFEYSGGPGDGLTFVFQHGLGSDLKQPLGLFDPPPGIHLIAFDFRAHGETEPVGASNKISIAAFADDLGAYLDYLALDVAIVGGVSLGAAVALNFALRYPKRVIGLILSRPAWLDGPMESNVKIFGQIATLIRQYGATTGLKRFRESDEHKAMLREYPATASSLVSQFQSPRAEERVVRLERLPRDAPCRDLNELNSIVVPTLVLANRQDPIHPIEYGERIARAISRAEFRELVSKSVNEWQHRAELQKYMTDFLAKHFLRK
jgi:pimeloyl-ACP methyl ester carboxylesterase